MARLIFNEEDHEYKVDGVVYPSVTEIIRFLYRELYDTVIQSRLDRAAERGRAVHKASEALDKYGKVECDEDIAPYMMAYKHFLQDYKPDWIEIEKPHFHKEYLYAGTPDRFGKITYLGERITALIDMKATYLPIKRLIFPQLNGYEKIVDERPDKLFGLHLERDESYNLIEVPFDDSEFMACLTLHNHMESTRCDRYKLRMQIEKEKSE